MSDRAKPPRLFVESPLSPGAELALGRDQAHYLGNVMRRGPGDAAVLFNGRDGEWSAAIASGGKREMTLSIAGQLRPQAAPPDIQYCFAPLKRARIDFIAQKATELGAAVLRPVITRHTVAERVRLDRLKANAIEAAEQCEILWVPEIREPLSLDRLISELESARNIIFCDEAAPIADPVAALRQVGPGPLAVLVGPEGGFSDEERAMLLSRKGVTAISLGPRVMRADTAGVAALALVQAVLGDWR